MFKQIYKWSKHLLKQKKISLFRQAIEIINLKKHNIGISEYYELELFDRKKYPDVEMLIGRKSSNQIDKLLNHNYWRATANDKILNYALLSHFNLPIPLTVATYKTQEARINKEISINEPTALHDFFSKKAQYPLFIKPVHGSYGRATFSLSSYNSEQKTFTSSVNKQVGLADILSAGDNSNFSGLLIQSSLIPNKTIAEVTGPNTSCVRIILIKDGNNTFIHRAFWKIARFHNITDNFSYGKYGNLLADIDIKSGKVRRVINGLWPHKDNVSVHPDTQKKLIGFQLPNWENAMKCCITASNIFTGLSLQSWDVAFCQEGPVLMELNTEPNLEIPQMLSEQAFLDDRLLKILKQKG